MTARGRGSDGRRPPGRSRPGGRAFGRVLLVASLGGLLAACLADGTASERAPSPLSAGAASLEELARRALEGISVADTAALARLRLTEREHNELVWPELPAGRPDVGFPVELAWLNIELSDRKAVRHLLRRWSGRKLRFLGTECRGPTETFASFRVLTDCHVAFRAGVDGPEVERQLFKDVLVWGDRYKIFRFYE